MANSAVAVALSPDGRHVASGGGDGRVVLQNTGNGSVATLAEGKGPIFGLDFSADGKYVAAASATAGCSSSTSPAAHPLAHRSSVRADESHVAFSPDGRMLAVTTEDGVILWDVGTRQRIGEFDHPNGSGITEAAGAGAHRIRRRVLTRQQGAGDDVGRQIPGRMEPRSADWTRRACEVAGRNLTREEWRQNIGDQPYHRTCPQWAAG